MKNDGQKQEQEQDGGQGVRFDLERDADLIAASFRQAYGIDLVRERDGMPWPMFLALLGGLPGETALGRAIAIRRAEVPRETAENREAVRELKRAKEWFSLGEEPEDESFDEKMNRFFGF